MSKFTSSLLRTTAFAALLGGLVFAQPVMAQSDDNQSTAAAPSAASATPSQSAPEHTKGSMEVEKRIKTLHDKLKITPDQETDWGAVAQTMRDNEATMYQLIQARHKDAESMTAIDDLQSYQKITQAHADGLTKMISSFQTLYSEMPEAQQKNADEVFGRFEGHRGAKMHHGHKKSS